MSAEIIYSVAFVCEHMVVFVSVEISGDLANDGEIMEDQAITKAAELVKEFYGFYPLEFSHDVDVVTSGELFA